MADSVWIVPSGGWEVDCNGVKIRGQSYADLVKAYTEHHRNNGIPRDPKELQAEVDSKLKLQQPRSLIVMKK